VTEWKSLAGKFTLEQIEVIRQFQTKLDLNENQFVRISVMMMVFFVGSLLKLIESEEIKMANKEYYKLKKKISKSPELEKVQSTIEDMTKDWEQALKRIVKENEPEIKKFTKKRKVGRPKSRKKKRGRPKDTGI